MSELTIVDAEDIEQEITLEDRVKDLEQLTKMLLEQHKNILEHLREMAKAVTEINSDHSEE